MILDKMENLHRYAELGPHFRTAADYLSRTDLLSIPLGNHEVDGRKVYIMSQENHLVPKDMFWEAHAKYADLQIVLTSAECFAWGYEGRLGELDETRDFRTCEVEKYIPYQVDAGMFTIFLPGEMHSPGNAPGHETVCRKLVVKVLCEA